VRMELAQDRVYRWALVFPFSLLTEHHTMKACWESGGIAPLVL
jgi:hypothetical protein